RIHTDRTSRSEIPADNFRPDSSRQEASADPCLFRGNPCDPWFFFVLKPAADPYLFCASAKAESKSRPADLKPIRSLTTLAASAAPYSRPMPQSSHSTESGPS